MFKLFKKAYVLAPEDLGLKDVLVVGNKIVMIENNIDCEEFKECVEVYNLEGSYLVPGFIDQHVHMIGGGGEGGFATRTPEVMLSDLTTCGITSVVGVLGTDNVTRHMESLLAKARGLEEEGLSTWIYSGAYPGGNPNLTGSLRSDIILIDKIVGGKVAMSDHRSAQPTKEDIMKLAAEARVGGMLSGKAGVLHIHMGEGQRKMDFLFKIAEETELMPSQFTPTHVNRNREVLEDGIKLAKAGAVIDLTCTGSSDNSSFVKTYEAVKVCIDAGVPLDKITMSSDSNGSMPVFNEKKEIIGLAVASASGLLESVVDIVEQEVLSLAEAIKLITTNPANSLKLKNKGKIALSYDADLVVLKQDLTIKHVFAKGKCMIKNQQVVVKGTFEK